ncbi:MAG: GldG family protein [Spirochaetota bacterium]
MISQKWKEISLLLLTLLVAVLVMMNAQRYFLRFDLTEDKIYTISEVSKNLFTEVDEQVTITYYVSDKLRSVTQIPQQIEDLLYEYATYGRGKIKVSVVDPDKTGVTEEIQDLGIEPRQIQVVERNEQTYAKVYSGILIRYLDKREVLPLAFTTQTLEYEITSGIRRLVREDERRIGILIGNSSMTLQRDFSALYDTLSGSFEVEELGRGEIIPPRIDVLFLLGAGGLNRFELLHIDQYLMRGGKAFLGIDGVKIDLDQNLKASPYEDSPIFDALESYGVRVEEKLVLDRYAKDFRVPQQVYGGMAWEVIGRYPHWINIRPGNVSSESLITARFQGLDLLWPSPVEILSEGQGRIIPLVKSSNEAWIMDERFITDPYRMDSVNRNTAEAAGQYTLGVAVEKQLDSFFSGEQVNPPAGESLPYEEIRPRSDYTRLIVFGDSDFASNIIQYSNSMYNMDFLLNCADWLAKDDDLMQIRTRNERDTRLNRLDPQRAQAQYIFSQIMNMVLIPLLIVGYGIIRSVIRRKQHGFSQEEYHDIQK